MPSPGDRLQSAGRLHGGEKAEENDCRTKMAEHVHSRIIGRPGNGLDAGGQTGVERRDEIQAILTVSVASRDRVTKITARPTAVAPPRRKDPSCSAMEKANRVGHYVMANRGNS